MRLILFFVATLGACANTYDPVKCKMDQDCVNPLGPAYCNPADSICYLYGDMGLDGGTDALASCGTSADCHDDSLPICDNGSCRACQSANDDSECAVHKSTTPRCGGSGKCVACGSATQAQDCTTATAPICDGSTNVCRACATHSECGSGVCKSDGSCVDASMIAYVNNSSGACSDSVHASTPASPYCQVQAAATTSGKAYVVVAGSLTAYNALAFVPSSSDLGPVTIVGPGRGATPTAKVAQAGVAALTVSVTVAHSANVTVDGFELSGAGSPTPADAVACTRTAGTAAVTVKNSLLDNSGGAGVNSTGCTIVVDANVIGPSNGAGGISITSGSYTITNNIVWGNGGVAATVPGVQFGNSATGSFDFNTIAKNLVSSAAGVGGIDCGSGGAKTVSNSIVYQNTTTGGTQLGAQCNLTNVVTAAGDDTRGLMVATPPAFVSATDFHLQLSSSANAACCVDKVASDPGTPNKDHDVDNSKRPKGAGWDYGAHEVQ